MSDHHVVYSTVLSTLSSSFSACFKRLKCSRVSIFILNFNDKCRDYFHILQTKICTTLTSLSSIDF